VAGRAGPGAAVPLLVRAAALTSSGPDRARRLVAAAVASWHGGNPTSARTRLDAAEREDPRTAEGHAMLALLSIL
jgi:uncharacterized membrane-anchored protein